MQSILFLGSKPIGYACLAHLLTVQEALGAQVTGVLTQARKEFSAESDLAVLAATHGIPVIASTDEMPACDIIYSVQYHEILKQRHIDKAAQIAVNLHMAPLPEYRGSNQFSYAIIEGKAEFGTTVHGIDARIDHGDILFERRFPIPPGCWIDELYALTEDASLALFEETLPQIISGDYTLTPQAALLVSRGSALHFRRDIAALKEIDFSWPGERIIRHIRATSMPGFEPPYAIIGDEKVYFSRRPS